MYKLSILGNERRRRRTFFFLPFVPFSQHSRRSRLRLARALSPLLLSSHMLRRGYSSADKEGLAWHGMALLQ